MSKDPQQRSSFTCACVQFNVTRGDVERNLEQAVAGVTEAAECGAKLVVLPELWPTSFVPKVTDSLLAASRAAEETMIELSANRQLVIVGGGLDQEGGQTFNRARIIDSGKVLGSYSKIHLFSPNAENRHLSAGDSPLIADTSLGRIGVLICYDIRFPELVRYYFYQNVDILAVPSQWPEARTEHWRTLLKARAIENEMFVVGCNRTGVESSLKTDEKLHFPGDSRIIDPMGDAIGAGAGEEGPVMADLELRKLQSMRRILPIHKDRRTDVYEQLWRGNWSATPESGSRVR